MNYKIFRMQTIRLGHIPRKCVTLSNARSNYTSPNQTKCLLLENITSESKIETLFKHEKQIDTVVLTKNPNLIYVQNPFTWLTNKFRLRLLRYTWDHEFEEKEFKRGATQVSVIIILLI